MKKVLIVIVIILVVAAGIFLLTRKDNAGTNGSPTATPTPSQTSTSNSGPVKTFESKNLGIQFKYLSQIADWGTVGVKEIGNKVYVYVGNAAPESGQSAESFKKNTNETFEASIRRQILANFPSPSCKVTVTPSNIQSGYQVAEISYPAPTDKDAPFWQNAGLCNEKYAKSNGMRYFLYDPKHPDSFLFVDIGQYAIPADNNTPWQYTIKFGN
jgi:hypothetical protein